MIFLNKFFVRTSVLILFLLTFSFTIYSFLFLFNNEDNIIELPYYIAIMGLDSNDDHIVRTDAIMVASVKENSIDIVSIPRDLLLEVNNNKRRINSIFINYGIDSLLNEINKILDIEIDKYVIFDFDIFRELGNLLQPINIFVEKEMHYVDYNQNLEIKFERGYNSMDGNDLLSYVRFRDHMGDISRIERQKNAVFSLLESINKKGFRTLMEALELGLNSTENNFKLNETILLYSKLRNIDINFLSLPIILEQNYVLIDYNNLKQFVAVFKGEEDNTNINITSRRKRVIFSRSFVNYNYNFYTYIFSSWNKPGYSIKVLTSVFEELDNTKSYVIFKNNTYKDEILEDLISTYSKSEFIVITDKNIYFDIIKHFSSNLVNPKNFDAMVILSDQL